AVIRQGNWKLIEHFETGKLELYNLKTDIGETTDLSEQEPKRTAELYQRLRAWQKEVDADMMLPNLEFMK
ncbi:MAG: sulfatase, partial [Blastopirellula sp.]